VTRRPSARRALLIGSVALAMEILLIMPFTDHWADRNSTAHFTQHALIFLGGVLMGFALRDMALISRR
jgi:hypothetical protein